MPPKNSYKLDLAKPRTCADVSQALIIISDNGHLALGLAGRSLLYYARDGSFIGISFVSNPRYFLPLLDAKYPQEMERELLGTFNELGSRIQLIFQPEGAYERWSKFHLATKIVASGEERERKTAMQVSIFEELLDIFSAKQTAYRWKKIDLEELLRQA